MIGYAKVYVVGVAVVLIFSSIASLPTAIDFAKFGTLRQVEVLSTSCDNHDDVLVKLYNSPDAAPSYASVGNCYNLKVGDVIRLWGKDGGNFSEESPQDILRGDIIVSILFSLFLPAIIIAGFRFRSALRPFG